MVQSNERTSLRSLAWELRPRDQGTVAGLVVFGLSLLMGATFLASRRGSDARSPVDSAASRSGWIDWDAAVPRTFAWRVDVNSAPWTELAVLPQVGDQLARDIVEDRRRRGPFRSALDLRRVRGVGPRTLQRIEPWLAPFEETP